MLPTIAAVLSVAALLLAGCPKPPPAPEYAVALVADGGAAHVRLEAGPGMHINADYPIAFTPEGGPRQPLKDVAMTVPCAAEPKDACVLTAPVTVETTGVLAFSVCNPERCLIEKVPLARVR